MGTKEPRHVTALSDAIGRVVQYVAYELNKEGMEGAILGPLGEFPLSAECCAQWLCDFPEDFYLRCVGALIPAFSPRIRVGLLEELWAEEAARRRKTDDEMVVMETNSVAERFVIVAVRWVHRAQPYREAGFGVLEDIVQRAIGGEDWNDAHFALAALVKHKHPRAAKLLSAARKAKGGPEFLSLWASSLADGKTEFLDQGDVLSRPSPLNDFELPKKHQKHLELLLKAAKAFDAAEQGAEWTKP